MRGSAGLRCSAAALQRLCLRCEQALTDHVHALLVLRLVGAFSNALVFLTGFASVAYCVFYTLQARSE